MEDAIGDHSRSSRRRIGTCSFTSLLSIKTAHPRNGLPSQPSSQPMCAILSVNFTFDLVRFRIGPPLRQHERNEAVRLSIASCACFLYTLYSLALMSKDDNEDDDFGNVGVAPGFPEKHQSTHHCPLPGKMLCFQKKHRGGHNKTASLGW